MNADEAQRASDIQTMFAINVARCQKLLWDTEYQRYEVSVYANGGMRCKHNMNYWRFGD